MRNASASPISHHHLFSLLNNQLPKRTATKFETAKEMKLSKRNILSRLAVCLAAILCSGILISCDAMHEDLEPCPQGARLRFVYNYNMEFANAFPSQVDCLTLLVYDENGVFVDSFTETSRVLADENWRMTIPLAPGKYRFVAWGGMADDKSSFHFTQTPASVNIQDLQVAMNNECMTSPVGTQLHPLFYGDLEMDIPEESMDYEEATVYMMKDTNNIRILLQQLNGKPVNDNDFNFVIADDNNTLLDWLNIPVMSAQPITYYPWICGQASSGLEPDGTEAVLAFAEFSTSRLYMANRPRLVVTRNAPGLQEDGATVIDIPLINYLLLLKSQEFSSMGPQEFLDRESRWDMIFFLDENKYWVKTYIKINDWIVRVNNAEL